MKHTKLFAALALSITALNSQAKPIELDTKDAHVVIVRPMDSWGNGDALQNEGLLDFHAEKKYAFVVEASTEASINKTKRIVFLDSSPLSEAVKIAGAQKGFVPNTPAATKIFTLNNIAAPVTLSPTDAIQLTEVQNKLWGQEVIKLGDPDTLTKRFQKDKDSNHWGELGGALLGTVLGAVGGHFIGNTMGASAGGLINTGSGATIGMLIGLSPEESKFVPSHKGLFVFSTLPKVDYSKYQSVDVRSVTYQGQFGRYGNIIIAYKGEKTEQAEQDALIAAIPVLLGFNESVDQIETARAEDFAARKALWNKYVAEKAAKGD